MRLPWLAVALSVVAIPASAHVPSLNATCPGGIEVHADEGGPIYINGQEAQIGTASGDFYEASSGGVTIDMSVEPDGSATVSYTAPGGANGICQINDSYFGRMETCPVDVSEADRYRYPACN